MQETEDKLRELVSSSEGRAIMFLTPLAVVAWVDGEPEMDELMTIAGHHASERCEEEMGCLSEEARQFFYYNFVYKRPSTHLVGVSLTLLARALSRLHAEESDEVMELISRACDEVARITGGGFLKNRASREEDAAIIEMLKFVRPRRISTARELAEALGFGNDGSVKYRTITE